MKRARCGLGPRFMEVLAEGPSLRQYSAGNQSRMDPPEAGNSHSLVAAVTASITGRIHSRRRVGAIAADPPITDRAAAAAIRQPA